MTGLPETMVSEVFWVNSATQAQIRGLAMRHGNSEHDVVLNALKMAVFLESRKRGDKLLYYGLTEDSAVAYKPPQFSAQKYLKPSNYRHVRNILVSKEDLIRISQSAQRLHISDLWYFVEYAIFVNKDMLRKRDIGYGFWLK